MRAVLMIQLELPEQCDGMSLTEYNQAVGDGIVNHAIASHAAEAARWAALDKGQGDEPTAEQSFNVFHNTWHDVLKNATWAVVAVPEKE